MNQTDKVKEIIKQLRDLVQCEYENERTFPKTSFDYINSAIEIAESRLISQASHFSKVILSRFDEASKTAIDPVMPDHDYEIVQQTIGTIRKVLASQKISGL